MSSGFPLTVLPVLLFAGCLGQGGHPHAGDWGDVGAGTLLVVGTFKLTPPLEKREQLLNFHHRRFRNRALLFLSPEEPDWHKPYSVKDTEDRIEVTFGELVFAACPRRSFSVVQGHIYLDYHTPPFDKAILPGGLRVEVSPEDKAVYIGTIEYRRDEFFKIIGLGVEDDFKAAQAEYEKKFGADIPLRKSLALRTIR